MNRIAPVQGEYEHFKTTQDANGSAHIKSSLLGSSVMFPYYNGKIAMSDKHRIVLIDFDFQEAVRTVWFEANINKGV